ncbi:hypothetical protein P8C59_007084 [Phyllachora maydis]|uniref:Uncharacterized protein n=1 Tax=Phyllachora maydis TaxID=1825666 RepID=A0AAD9MD68_9PEZI|nr:hypothetical protein P8C59_007084 [Phyllachora maydis]
MDGKIQQWQARQLQGILARCSTIDIPFPNARLASIALRTIQVDKELSSLVRRTLSTVSGDGSTAAGVVLRAETSLSSWK